MNAKELSKVHSIKNNVQRLIGTGLYCHRDLKRSGSAVVGGGGGKKGWGHLEGKDESSQLSQSIQLRKGSGNSNFKGEIAA